MRSTATVVRLPRTDQELMVEISAGDADAFGALYDRYCGRAYRVARSVCRNDSQAEDAVQEAFLSVWKGRTSYVSQRGTAAGWVLTVVRYRAIDIARRNRANAAHEASDATVEALPAPGDLADRAVAGAEADRLRFLLARLPDAQREVITLAFFGELTHAEIAAHLGLPPGTVKGRMRLGLQKLRGQLLQISAQPAHRA